MVFSRHRLRHAPALVVLIVLVGLAVPRYAAPPSASTIAEYLDAVTAAGVPGVSVVITQGDTVVERHAAGSLTTHSRAPVASLTKAFTATAVMVLAEQGRLALDDPVHAHLPWFVLDDKRANDITIRQVLNQSSGLTDRTLGFDQYSVDPTTAHEAVALLATSHLAYPPGSSWDYCNANYWIAQAVVEAVSGRSLQEFLDLEVLTPLGMDATSLVNHTGDGRPGTTTHAYVYGRAVPMPAPRTFTGGAGGLWSTIDDLARWTRFQHGHGPGVGEVLNQRSLDEMHRRQSPLHQYAVGYALGWWNGEPAEGGVQRISHSGTGAGHSAYIGLFPNDRAIAVVVNASSPRADGIAADLMAVQKGQPRTPMTAPEGWSDSAVSAVTLLVLLTCAGGVRRRLRGGITHWRCSTIAAALTLAMAALVAVAPALVTRLTSRQVTWAIMFTAVPIPVVCLVLVGLACATLALVHGYAFVGSRGGRWPRALKEPPFLSSTCALEADPPSPPGEG